MSLLSTARDVLSSEGLLMPVVYISAVTMLLLGVLYAGSASRRLDNASQKAVADLRAGTVEEKNALSAAPPAETAQSERESELDRRFLQIEAELARLKRKLDALEARDPVRGEDQGTPTDVGSGRAIAALRNELEALNAEMKDLPPSAGR